MAQYVEYTDGSTNCRDGVRDNAYVIDIELTATGFDGTEDVDWENLETIQH
jgi:hypothetical protein